MSPDDVCGVCDTKRDEHGDKNHVFSIEGMLIPKSKPEPPRKEAPRERSSLTTSEGPDTALALASLVEILAEKKIINARDILRIFGPRAR